MAWGYRKNARHRNPKKDAVRKAVCNKTKRKTKSEMAGWHVPGPEKDGYKRMERQSKEPRDLEAYFSAGQGPPRAVAPSDDDDDRVIKNGCRGFNNSPGHLVLQMQPQVISFYGVTSRIRFMFLPQASRNWRYESEPPLKPSPLTCCKQFGTKSIIVLIFVESQRVHI